ncbi:hypothetical protein PG988_001802 [Apiospora saccharicola]
MKSTGPPIKRRPKMGSVGLDGVTGCGTEDTLRQKWPRMESLQHPHDGRPLTSYYAPTGKRGLGWQY